MPGGGRQAGAGVLIERVVVLLLESLSGVGGGRADGLRQLPVVDGAAVPGDGRLRWEGVAGLRHLPLKPGGEKGHGITEGWRRAPQGHLGCVGQLLMARPVGHPSGTGASRSSAMGSPAEGWGPSAG